MIFLQNAIIDKHFDMVNSFFNIKENPSTCINIKIIDMSQHYNHFIIRKRILFKRAKADAFLT